MIEKLKTILEEIFDEDFSTIEKFENFKEFEDWDSLKYVTLVLSLEKQFKINFKKEDIQQLLSVAGIKSALIKCGVQENEN